MVSARLAACFILVAVLAGIAVDTGGGTAVDYWVHDPALVYRARTRWQDVAIVVLDRDVPVQVSRRQALPLFAKAAERLLRAGAKGVFLDARLSKEMETFMPYAVCMESKGTVRWSSPQCTTDSGAGCVMAGSRVGMAPLAMQRKAFSRFLVAPYLPSQNPLPDFLLYGWEAVASIPEEGLVAADRLVSKDMAVMRWMDLSNDHAVVRLAMFVDPEGTSRALAETGDDEVCDGGYACRRVRLSPPVYRTQMNGDRMIAPVSLLSDCNESSAMASASRLKDKAVILQLTSPTEATDLIVTPMATAWGGPHVLTPGAQFLADAVETLLLQDHPRAPSIPIKVALFTTVAVLTVLCSTFQSQWVFWGIFPLLAGMVTGLCFGNRMLQLWPVTATFTVYFTAVAQVIGLNLVIGLREGRLIRRYMPRQIHNLLVSLHGGQRFRNRRHRAIVLMSDVANYTTVTGLLGDPACVLELMNDYLEETSVVLQKKYQGWLEGYVGDMVCYYWPIWEKEPAMAYENALQGAAELACLQKRFFAGLDRRYAKRFSGEAVEQVAAIISAGIGLASGNVVMGDLGPKSGVRKFGILGDPLNLAARLESLTRNFTGDMIVAEDMAAYAGHTHLVARRLGCISVKGKLEAVTVYALGDKDDERFSARRVSRWEQWLAAIERGGEPTVNCPEIYAKDRQTLIKWKARGWLRGGIWFLDEK